MKTLTLTTNECSAGRLKASKAADRVMDVAHRLIDGPLPTAKMQIDFFESVQLEHDKHQDDIHHWRSGAGIAERKRYGLVRPSLVECCRAYDRIQIWAEADPNSYRVFCQLIDALKLQPDILDRLSLAFPAKYLGEITAAQFEKDRPPVNALTTGQLQLACRAWQAHSFPTPERWFELLREDTSEIPGLRTFILRLLAELPAITNGLSASEAQLLGLICLPGANYETVLGGYTASRPRPTPGFWDAGERTFSLACCDPPIIVGIKEKNFSIDLFADKAYYDAYRKKPWSLSPLGQRIADGHEDLAKVIHINRWIGNTHLTPDRLWRWDAAGETLVKDFD